MLGLWGFQWWGPPKAPGLLFAGFEMCLALGDPLAPPVFHQGPLEEACSQTGGIQGPLEMESGVPRPLAPGRIPSTQGCAASPLAGQILLEWCRLTQGSHCSCLNGSMEKEASGSFQWCLKPRHEYFQEWFYCGPMFGTEVCARRILYGQPRRAGDWPGSPGGG